MTHKKVLATPASHWTQQTPPASADALSKATFNPTIWKGDIRKERITTLTKSNLKPILLQNGNILYMDTTGILKIRVIEEIGTVTDHPVDIEDLTQPIIFTTKTQDQLTLIVDSDGKIFSATDTESQKISDTGFQITLSPETPIKEVILHNNQVITLYKNGNMAIFSKEQPTQYIEIDEEHQITTIKIDPITDDLFYAVFDTETEYSTLKSKSIDVNIVARSKIIQKRIAGTVHKLDFTPQALYFRSEDRSFSGTIKSIGKTNHLYTDHMEEITAHSTPIGSLNFPDPNHVITGANDIHIIGTKKIKSEGKVYTSEIYPEIATQKFEDIKGHPTEKGRILDITTTQTEILVLKQLDANDDFALFKLTPEKKQ